MTDPISRLNPALELLRQRLAEQAQRLDSPAKGVSARAGGAPTGQADRSGTLKQRLSERLAAVDAADPQRDRKRRRVFIESVLASELGEALQNDGLRESASTRGRAVGRCVPSRGETRARSA